MSINRPKLAMIFVAIGLFLLFCVHPTLAAPNKQPTASIIVTTAPDEQSVTIEYTLPKAVRKLPLAGLGFFSGSPEIEIQTKGVTLDDEGFASTAPFKTVLVKVTPDKEEINSVYPLLAAVRGRGLVLYAYHILPTELDSRLELHSKSGLQIFSQETGAALGYLLLGDKEQEIGGIKNWSSDDIPTEMAERITARASRLIAYYTKAMGKAAPVTPTIVLSKTVGRYQRAMRGDVGDNGVIFMRFPTSTLEAYQAEEKGTTSFLAHELFHLWNGGNEGSEADWWLHEGGAEFAAWRAMADMWPDDMIITKNVNDALYNCASSLGEKALRTVDSDTSRNARYPCGAGLMWLADLAARKEGTASLMFC